MEFATGSHNWIDRISGSLRAPATGFILIDGRTGMCLDVRGVASKDDAAKLYLSVSALDESGNGSVSLRDNRVILRKEDNCLIGVYMDSSQIQS
ncbi:uncharacterized protein V2V93DRAFT_365140 [Kockiozyma suomiensis]|uniref:uncharacterized protein n=1 Tax=Kockiozyma suomiensis TaxID=1337062 RepID=UPI0033440E9E